MTVSSHEASRAGDGDKHAMPVPEPVPQNIYPLRDTVAPAEPEPFYQNYQYDVPIALDVGTNSFKIGLTNSEEPNNVFPSLVARWRDRKGQRTLTVIGNDIFRDAILRSSLKGPYDGPLVTNWDYMEYLLDYSFEHLGVHSDVGRVNNPIIMTEPVACPLSQRKNMYELLFEAYQVPKVALGIDSLFSFYANSSSPHSSGLVIGTGNELTHLIPVISGKGILLQTKRIDFGGNLALNFILKLLALKYPHFPTKLSSQNISNIFQDHCYVLTDYQKELAGYLDVDFLDEHDVVLQAPVDLNSLNNKKKTEEELARQAQKKREQGKRLQEQAQQKRAEKLLQKEQELQYYRNLKVEIELLAPEEVQPRMEAEEFEDLNDFKKYLASLEKTLKRSKNQDGDQEAEESDSWPLVEIPDDQLTDDQIKEKRKQKLLKANYEARLRAKEAKKQEEELAAKQAKEEEEWRENDIEGWSSQKRIELSNAIKRVKERTKLLNSFKDRKSAAMQQRMKNIADLANDGSGSTSAATRKRRRNVNSTIDNDPNDTFGANDDDWSVYKDITNASVEEEQEEDRSFILKLEEQLLKYDPNFHYEDTLAATEALDWKSSNLHKFLHGPRQNVAVTLLNTIKDMDELANHPEVVRKNHQIHFNIERIRVPEILFQPSIAGLDQAGISELLEGLIYKRLDGNFSEGGQSYDTIRNVFITGGLANLPNLRNRIVNDFTEFLPTGAPLNVRVADDPLIDAWKGMQKWAQSGQDQAGYVSKEEYDEMGPEYIKEHGLGNVCLL